MSLFGWKEQKELDVYREVAARDKRTGFQVSDLKKAKEGERLVVTLVLAAIALSILAYMYAKNIKL